MTPEQKRLVEEIRDQEGAYKNCRGETPGQVCNYLLGELRVFLRGNEAGLRLLDDIACSMSGAMREFSQRQAVRYLLSLLSEQEAVIERLPRTADGVPVTLGMPIVRAIKHMGKLEMHKGIVYGVVEKPKPILGWLIFIRFDTSNLTFSNEECYSTEAAALAAQENSK